MRLLRLPSGSRAGRPGPAAQYPREHDCTATLSSTPGGHSRQPGQPAARRAASEQAEKNRAPRRRAQGQATWTGAQHRLAPRAQPRPGELGRRGHLLLQRRARHSGDEALLRPGGRAAVAGLRAAAAAAVLLGPADGFAVAAVRGRALQHLRHLLPPSAISDLAR